MAKNAFILSEISQILECVVGVEIISEIPKFENFEVMNGSTEGGMH